MSTVNEVETADFRGPLDVTRAATAVLDAEGTIIGWGLAAERLLGYPPDQAIGRPIGRLIVDRAGACEPGACEPGDDLPGAARAGRRVLSLRHRDGRVVRVAAATLPLSHAATGPARLLVIADADETERWEALQSMLRGLVTQSPVGLAIYDTDLKVVWTNFALYQTRAPESVMTSNQSPPTPGDVDGGEPGQAAGQEAVLEGERGGNRPSPPSDRRTTRVCARGPRQPGG